MLWLENKISAEFGMNNALGGYLVIVKNTYYVKMVWCALRIAKLTKKTIS